MGGKKSGEGRKEMGKIAQTERCVRRYNMKPGQEIKKKGVLEGCRSVTIITPPPHHYAPPSSSFKSANRPDPALPLLPPAILWRRFYISKRQKRKGDQ